MTGQPTKISIKFGNLEVSYEGVLSELKDQLPDLMEIMSEYTKLENFNVSNVVGVVSSNVIPIGAGSGKIEATTNTIAAKIGCTDGQGLIKSAALQLTLAQSKDKFTRAELLKEMQTSSHYKATYGKNLTSYLKALFKDFLNEAQKDVYSIKPAALAQYQIQLAAA